MNVYIYDYFVNEKRYNRDTTRLETRITDLGLNGRIYRVGINQNISNLITNEIGTGIKTIILVGDDSTINRSLDAVAEKKVPIAIVPIGKNNTIARCLGVGTIEDACNILASRRIEIIDLGQANGAHFLNKATISTKNTVVKIDSGYSIEVSGEGMIKIINLPISEDLSDREYEINHSPSDSKLDLVIDTKEGRAFSKKTSQTILPFNNLSIYNSATSLLLDGVRQIACPAEIKISNKKLNMIVGKNRIF